MFFPNSLAFEGEKKDLCFLDLEKFFLTRDFKEAQMEK